MILKNYIEEYPEILLDGDASIMEAVEIIDRTNSIVLVVDGGGRLLGTVTDSDVRKALIAGIDLQKAVRSVMNSTPAAASAGNLFRDVQKIRQTRNHAWFPVVDEHSVIVALYHVRDILREEHTYDNEVVILAGGVGKRLRPHTLDTPKPMMPIGDRPLLEIILGQLIDAGFRRFRFSVGYLSHKIIEHFGDGRQWGVEIRYLREDWPLGTAGPLSRLDPKPTKPVLVLNGDLLTHLKFNLLMNYHQMEGGMATVAVRDYTFSIPFGIVNSIGPEFVSIEEKPEQRCQVNAGIYVINPEAIDLLKYDEPCDMPNLLRRIKDSGSGMVSCFPMKEFWLDIGYPEDYRRAISEFNNEAERE